jgi:hypothetical protein
MLNGCQGNTVFAVVGSVTDWELTNARRDEVAVIGRIGF